MYFITKNGPTFWPSSLNPSKSRKQFYCQSWLWLYRSGLVGLISPPISVFFVPNDLFLLFPPICSSFVGSCLSDQQLFAGLMIVGLYFCTLLLSNISMSGIVGGWSRSCLTFQGVVFLRFLHLILAIGVCRIPPPPREDGLTSYLPITSPVSVGQVNVLLGYLTSLDLERFVSNMFIWWWWPGCLPMFYQGLCCVPRWEVFLRYNKLRLQSDELVGELMVAERQFKSLFV